MVGPSPWWLYLTTSSLPSWSSNMLLQPEAEGEPRSIMYKWPPLVQSGLSELSQSASWANIRQNNTASTSKASSIAGLDEASGWLTATVRILGLWRMGETLRCLKVEMRRETSSDSTMFVQEDLSSMTVRRTKGAHELKDRQGSSAACSPIMLFLLVIRKQVAIGMLDDCGLARLDQGT